MALCERATFSSFFTILVEDGCRAPLQVGMHTTQGDGLCLAAACQAAKEVLHMQIGAKGKKRSLQRDTNLRPLMVLLVLMCPHQKNWHCLDLFRPPYVSGQCWRIVRLWCMHCEGGGFCLHSAESYMHGRAHPNTYKWLFERWCEEVDVYHVMVATLPKPSFNPSMASDNELEFSPTALASPPPLEERKSPPTSPIVTELRPQSRSHMLTYLCYQKAQSTCF